MVLNVNPETEKIIISLREEALREDQEHIQLVTCFPWSLHHLSIELHVVDKMWFNTYIYIFLQQSLLRYCLL